MGKPAGERSIREELEDAMDGTDAPEADEIVESGHTEQDHADADAKEETGTDQTQEEVPETPAAQATSELQAEVDRAQQQTAKEPKPPVDWDVALKQKWKDLPAEVKAAVAERERSVSMLMQQTANHRKLADDFIRTAEPYRSLMLAEGIDNPLQAFEGLMRVTATLLLGSQRQKAARIAGLVQHYGIDIEMLDQALVGSLPQGNPQQNQFEQMLEQRMAPVNQLLAQINQNNQQQHENLYNNAYQSIEEFGADPRNEFFDDVRADMADFLDFAAQRSQPMTLDQAYKAACSVHPQISHIVSTRNPQQGMMNKRNAASSISGSGSGHSTAKDGNSLRETLEAHFGDSERI